MALEQEVLWALKVTGEERLERLRSVMNDTEKSFLANSQAAKELEKSLKQQLTATDLMGEKAKGMVADLVAFKNTSHDVMLTTTSDTGRMKDSYFSLGQEIRSNLKDARFEHRLAGESIRALGQIMGENAAGPISNYTTSLMSMSFSTKSLSSVIQASGTPAAVAFGQAMSAAAIPIAAVVAGVIELIGYVKGLTSGLEEATKKLLDLRIAGGVINLVGQKALLENQAKQQQAELDELDKRQPFSRGDIFGIGSLIQKRQITEEAQKKRAELQDTQNKLDAVNASIEKEKTDAINARAKAIKEEQTWYDKQLALLNKIEVQAPVYISDEQKKRFETGIAFSEHLRQLMLMPKAERQALQLESIQAGLIDSTSGTTAAKYLKSRTGTGQPESISKTMNEEFKVAKVAQDSFESGWNHMTREMSHQLANTVGKAFGDLFGGAKTLLGQFAADVASTFTQLAASAAVRGLFSILSMIPGIGPIFAFIGAGGSQSSGGSGHPARAGVGLDRDEPGLAALLEVPADEGEGQAGEV